MYEEENWDDEIAGLPPKSMPQPPVARQEWRPSSSSFSREQKSNTVCTCNHQAILLTNKYLLQSASLIMILLLYLSHFLDLQVHVY